MDVQPTYAEVLGQILAPAKGPLPVDEVIEQILALRPSRAKDPRRAARNKLREFSGVMLVFLDQQHILPIHLALARVQFRVRLSRKAVVKGSLAPLPFLPYFLVFHRLGFREVPLVDENGASLKAWPLEVLWGNWVMGEAASPLVLRSWLKARKARKGDHLIFRVRTEPEFALQVSLEPAAAFDAEAVAARDQELADILFEMLEAKVQEQLWTHRALPTAYARLGPEGPAPHDFLTVVDNDPRLVMKSLWEITYSDAPFPPIVRVFAEAQGLPTVPPPQEFPPEQGEKVYRFRVCPRYSGREGCKRVEILGKQSLAELHFLLAHAYGHDAWDHLGGFWKLVPRGKRGRRYRKVEVATIHPFEEGEGADTPIAGLGLDVGGRLRWVFDFGDWYEYHLKLEAITDREPGITYPREV